jgi:hypothetical protein
MLFQFLHTKIESGGVCAAPSIVYCDFFANFFEFRKHFFKLAIHLLEALINLLEAKIHPLKTPINLFKALIHLRKALVHLLGLCAETFLDHNRQIADGRVYLFIDLRADPRHHIVLYPRLDPRSEFIKHGPECLAKNTFRYHLVVVIFIYHTQIVVRAKRKSKTF